MSVLDQPRWTVDDARMAVKKMRGFNPRAAQKFDRREIAHDGVQARYTSVCALCHHPIVARKHYVIYHPMLNRYVHEMCPLSLKPVPWKKGTGSA